jgi:TonB family protein
MRNGVGRILWAGALLWGGVAAVAPIATAQVTARVYAANEVDKPAGVTDNSAGPKYPDALRPLALGGRVIAQFVVDSTGTVDTTSILIDDSANPLFAASVRDALATMRFNAAVKGGQRVAEEIVQSFLFEGTGPAPLNIDSVLKAEEKHFDYGSAAALPGEMQPTYPAALLAAGVEGSVLVGFTVDTTGRADMNTFYVASAKSSYTRGIPTRNQFKFEIDYMDAQSPDRVFIDAVRDAVRRMRFKPARQNGRNVDQVVEQPFTFSFAR